MSKEDFVRDYDRQAMQRASDAPPRPVRQRDLIQHRAMVAALHSVSQICPDLDFPTVSYIVEQYEASVAEQHLERQYEYEQKRGVVK